MSVLKVTVNKGFIMLWRTSLDFDIIWVEGDACWFKEIFGGRFEFEFVWVKDKLYILQILQIFQLQMAIMV